MDTSTIYWLTRIPEIKDMLPGDEMIALGIVSLALSVSTALMHQMEIKEGTEQSARFLEQVKTSFKRAAIFFMMVGCLGIVIKAFIPNERDLAIILASNSEHINELPESVAKSLNDLIKQYTPPSKEETNK